MKFFTYSLFFFLTWFSFPIWAQPVSVAYFNSGTWNCPAGYTANITVHAWGGGGGGNNGSGANGGGGGGAFAGKTFDVSSGSYTVTVGNGGAAGAAGGQSKFALGATNYVIAVGGSSGTSNIGSDGGLATACTGDVRYSGGTGGSSSAGLPGGGGGGSAYSSGNGSNGSRPAGGAGAGSGGEGGDDGHADGYPGNEPGGGGGATKGNAGVSASGAKGQVIVTVNSVLPVELVDFSVKAEKNKSLIQWTTLSELNNKAFFVERSADGSHFATLEMLEGGGSSNRAIQYQFMDEYPVPGTNYYRLKQVDFDGSTAWSKIIAVAIGDTKDIQLFPSSVSDQLHVRSSEGIASDAQWQVVDMNGRVVLEGLVTEGTADWSIPVASFTKGIYLLRLITPENVLTRQFRKL